MNRYDALRSLLQTPDSRAWRHIGDGWMISASFDTPGYASVALDISTEHVDEEDAGMWLAYLLLDAKILGLDGVWFFKMGDFCASLGYDPGLEGSAYDRSVKLRVNQSTGVACLEGAEPEEDGEAVIFAMEAIFPGLECQDITDCCPELSCSIPGYRMYTQARQALGQSVSDWVIHLNDNHKWSRERIADWLETLEVDLSARVE